MMITKGNLILLLKRVVVITAIFLAIGFILDITVNGFSLPEALERLYKYGLAQSLMYATVAAIALTPFKGGS
ncbi:MAG: hypothetical protein ACNS63_08455 [Candidatus Nitrospinota bacterium M3_3B_026]